MQHSASNITEAIDEPDVHEKMPQAIRIIIWTLLALETALLMFQLCFLYWIVTERKRNIKLERADSTGEECCKHESGVCEDIPLRTIHDTARSPNHKALCSVQSIANSGILPPVTVLPEARQDQALNDLPASIPSESRHSNAASKHN